MLVYSIKTTKKTLLLCATVLIAAAIVGTALISNAVSSSSPAIASEEAAWVKKQDVENFTAKTNSDRADFAKKFGWEIEDEPGEIMEVIIPAEFDDVYTNYNSIQKLQGFNLEKYRGKRVKRYSYTVTNYPDTTGEVLINLLIYKDKIIGGDISSANMPGFMHGFNKPEA